MTRPADLPPVSPMSRPALAPMEALYLRALVHWYRYKRQPPKLLEMCDLLRRSGAATTPHGLRKPRTWPSIRALRRGLLALEAKGYARRNQQGRFEVIR